MPLLRVLVGMLMLVLVLVLVLVLMVLRGTRWFRCKGWNHDCIKGGGDVSII